MVRQMVTHNLVMGTPDLNIAPISKTIPTRAAAIALIKLALMISSIIDSHPVNMNRGSEIAP